jgi:8-oxo-dGTP diphosphatase
MAKNYTYEFSRPALTVDIAVFGYQAGSLSILLIERGIEPYRGRFALPGGFVRESERLEETARRELQEETGLEGVFLEQLYTFDELDRDPRERVVTVSYYALVRPEKFILHASTDAAHVKWFKLSELPKLPFDHSKIIDQALQRLRAKIRYSPIGFELLPRQFTLTDLQTLYETLLETELDKRNFRKKILGSKILLASGKKLENVPFRSPILYAFDQKRYQKLEREGFEFRI